MNKNTKRKIESNRKIILKSGGFRTTERKSKFPKVARSADLISRKLNSGSGQ